MAYAAVVYIVHPWLPRGAVHATALANRRERAQRIPNKKDKACQIWLRRHLRFIAPMVLFRGRDHFCRLAAQNPHLAALLSPAAKESCACATARHTMSVRLVADSARARLAMRYLSCLPNLTGDIFKRDPRETRPIRPTASPLTDTPCHREGIPRNRTKKG